MTQTPRTKRPASGRKRNATNTKKAKTTKKASLARRAYEYEHHYGEKLTGKPGGK